MRYIARIREAHRFKATRRTGNSERKTTMKTVILTCYARNAAGQIGLIEDTRQKSDGQNGSHSVSTRWTGETYPNNRAGLELAAAECLRRNQAAKFNAIQATA